MCVPFSSCWSQKALTQLEENNNLHRDVIKMFQLVRIQLTVCLKGACNA